MACPNVIKKSYPENLITSIWPRHYLYDIDMQAVLDAVETLPERRRYIIRFRYEDRMTYAQIGEAMNVTPQRAKQLLTSAHAKIKKKSENAVRLKPKDVRENMLTAETLEGDAGRYTGVFKDPDMTFGMITGKLIDATECPCCGKPFDKNGYPYAGLFRTGENELHIRIICRDCAYAISPRVLEFDGRRHKSPIKNNRKGKAK